MPPENKEKRHDWQDHTRESKIEYEHCPEDKKRIERSLQNIRHQTRSQFGHLIDVLLHSVQFFPYRRRLMVFCAKAIHLFEDIEPNSENELLHSPETDQRRKR